jgi:hypothetical protein
MGQRIKTGDASKEDIETVENLERIVVLYDIMMDELIEKKGTLSPMDNSLSAADALNLLAREIGNATNHSKDIILKSLHHIYEQGAIKYNNKNERAQWKWAD